MKYIKTYENIIDTAGSMNNVIKVDPFGIYEDEFEVWELENDKQLTTGNSLWINRNELEELEGKGLVFYDTDIDKQITKYSRRYFVEKDREQIEEYLVLLRNVKQYNL